MWKVRGIETMKAGRKQETVVHRPSLHVYTSVKLMMNVSLRHEEV